jgi:predicted nucleic acid-binding protein
MTQRYGTDTSILVRLLTGLPASEFERCDRELTKLIEEGGAEIFASNQVIGEVYVAVQHHYGVTKGAARTGLLSVLTSGLVAPLKGQSVLKALAEDGGAGLLDRLIADDYSRIVSETLTLDRRMASLPGVRRL